MASKIRNLLTSPIYEVLASSELKPFFVHAGILSKSDTLKALVDGGWKDSVDHKIKLEEWDVDTVGRWLEWLYSGDYSAPYPEPSNPSPTLSDQLAATSRDIQTSAFSKLGLGDIVGRGQTRTYTSLEPYEREILTPLSNQHFCGVQYQHPRSSAEALNHWISQFLRQPQGLNYEATLLAHAKIYCLANYMLLPELQALAFEHIKTLLVFIDSLVAKSSAANSFVALIRYVYGNTNRPRTGEEPLQKLLTAFVALNTIDFGDGSGSEVVDLMKEGGDFAADVWCKVSAQMRVMGENIRNLGNEVRHLTPRKKRSFADVKAVDGEDWPWDDGELDAFISDGRGCT